MLDFLATAMIAVTMMATSAETPQPQWETSYGKALEATRSDDQPLLVVLDLPGQEEARVNADLLGEGSTDDQVFELLGNFQLCHVDASTEYGQRIAQAFKTDSFPYVAVIEKTGKNIIYTRTGEVSSDDWQQILAANANGVRTDLDLLNEDLQTHTTAYRGLSSESSSSSEPYCSSCQRRSY